MCPDKKPEHFIVMDNANNPVMQPHSHRPNRQGGMNLFVMQAWMPWIGRPLPVGFPHPLISEITFGIE